MKLGDIARESRETYKGNKTDIPIVGLEHLISGELRFNDYEVNTDNTFTKVFHKGQILFGRRRAYLKKAAVAEFDGICSGDITVIEAIPGKVDARLLPFIVQNDMLFDFAVSRSAGGLSPRVKWEHLADYEFELPSIEEQRVLADKLWAAYELKEAYKKMIAATDEMVKSQFIEMFGSYGRMEKLANLCSVSSGKSIPTRLEDIKGGIAYVKVADFNLPGNENYIYSSQRYVTEEGASYSKMIPVGSVIFAKNGAASLSNKKRLTKIDCCIDMNTMAITSKSNDLNGEFLFAIIQAMDISVHVRQGAVPSISPKSIEECMIPLPTLAEQYNYISIVQQADKSKFELQQAIDKIDKVIKSLVNEKL